VRLQSLLADSATGGKTRQRELDDRMEVIAGFEVEVGALRSESSRLKQELLTARESARRASADRSELEETNARAESSASQLARAISDAAVERDRFEKRVEEIRSKLRDEISAREQLSAANAGAVVERERLEKRFEEIRLQLGGATAARDQLERELASLSQRNEELSALRDRELASARQAVASEKASQERAEQDAARLQAELERSKGHVEDLETRIAAANRERGSTATRLERQEAALAELRRVVAEQADEAARLTHFIEALTSRATTAETNAATFQETGTELHGALTAAEAEIASLRSRIAQAEVAAAERDAALCDVTSLRAEVARIRPEANAAASARQRAATAEALLRERENATRALELELGDARERAAKIEALLLERDKATLALEPELGEARERAAKAELLLLDRDNAIRALELDLHETRNRSDAQNKDLAAAMEALAVTEETVETRIQTAAERIRAMKAEIRRLTDENETELLKVREDLETELRTTSGLLERRDGEIWELKEEVLRLHAQVAATVASQVSDGPMAEFQQSLAEQENQIFTLGEERDRIRTDNERLTRSVIRAKKNVRILVALLKKERVLRLKSGDPSFSLALSDKELDMISDLTDSVDAVELLVAAEARLAPQTETPAAPYTETAAEVDSVMDGLRVASPREDAEPTEKTEVKGERTRDSS